MRTDQPEERLKENNIENTIVFFGSARPKPQEVADRELGDFESKLVSGKTVAIEREINIAGLKESKSFPNIMAKQLNLPTRSAHGQESRMQVCVISLYVPVEVRALWKRLTVGPRKRVQSQLPWG